MYFINFHRWFYDVSSNGACMILSFYNSALNHFSAVVDAFEMRKIIQNKKIHKIKIKRRKITIAMIIIETRFCNFRCFLGENWNSWTSLIFAWLFFFFFDFVSRMYYFMQIWLAAAFCCWSIIEIQKLEKSIALNDKTIKREKGTWKQYKRISLWAYSIIFIRGIF